MRVSIKKIKHPEFEAGRASIKLFSVVCEEQDVAAGDEGASRAFCSGLRRTSAAAVGGLRGYLA